MKNQAIQYLAFDVHQAMVVASLRDESGKVVLRAEVILAFVKNPGPRVHVAFEEETQGAVAARSTDRLRRAGDRL
jgi:hypothetical protein